MPAALTVPPAVPTVCVPVIDVESGGAPSTGSVAVTSGLASTPPEGPEAPDPFPAEEQATSDAASTILPTHPRMVFLPTWPAPRVAVCRVSRRVSGPDWLSVSGDRSQRNG